MSNRDRWSWQCRSSSSGRSASDAAILMSSANRRWSACNASSGPPVVPLLLAARPAWHVQGKDFSEQSSYSSSRQGSQRLCRRRQALRFSPHWRAHKDVERFSFHKGHQHCVQLICQHSQSVQSITTSVAAFASATVADSLSTAHVKTFLPPGCTLTTKFSVRRAQDTDSVESFPNLSCPPRLDWLVLDLLRLTRPHPLSAQGTGASLTRLGRDLVADFAVGTLAATLDATVGSVSSTPPDVQRVVLDPFSRGPAVTFLAQASELSQVAAHPTFLNTNDQSSATMFDGCMRSVRAHCFHDNK